MQAFLVPLHILPTHTQIGVGDPDRHWTVLYLSFLSATENDNLGEEVIVGNSAIVVSFYIPPCSLHLRWTSTIMR
jgi:hypothetical protein